MTSSRGYRVILAALVVATGSPVVARAAAPFSATIRGTASAAPRPATDPIPLRRVLVPAGRLPAALRTLPPGPVVTLSRSAFDRRVRAAVSPSPAAVTLAEARYTATHGSAGFRGTLSWGFRAATGAALAGPVEFPLTNCGVALDQPADTGTVIALTRDGPLLRFDGAKPTLLTWSARTVAEGGAERVTLVLPPAPLATLDLDLPADRVPTLANGGASQELSGPLPGAAVGRQRRRVYFPGGGRVELLFRPVAPAAVTAPVIVNRVMQYDFAQGVVSFRQDFTLEAVRGTPDELVFDLDPRCRVTAVTTATRLAWTVEEAAGQPPRLRVRCPGGLPASVSVAGFAGVDPVAADGMSLPDISLVGGLPGADSVEIRCGPDVQWHGCDSGDFRNVAPPAGQTPSVAATYAFQAAPLAGSATGPARRRLPTVRVKMPGPVFTTVDDVTWFPGTPVEESRVAAVCRVTVTRGPLAALAVRLSPGYRVEAAEELPRDARVAVRGDRLELRRPVAAGETLEFRVHLAGPRVGPGESVPFPRFAFSDAAERAGSFTVVPPAGYGCEPSAAPAVALVAPTRLRYPLRGRTPNASAVFPRLGSAVRGYRETAATTLDGLPARVTTFTLSRAGDPLGTVRLLLPRTPGASVRPDDLSTRVEPVSPVEAWAPLLAAGHPLAAVAACAAPPFGGFDRVRAVSFPPEAVGPMTLRVYDSPPPDGPAPYTSVLDAVVSAAAAATVAPAPTPADWVFRGCVREVSIDADGRVRTELRGVLVTGGSAGWPLTLPPGAEILSVTVCDKAYEPVRVGDTLLLPPQCRTPAGDAVEVPFAVTFRTPDPVRGLAKSVTAPAVTLPGDPPLETTWRLAESFLRWPELDSPPAEAEVAGETITVVWAKLPAALGWVAAVAAVGGAVVAASRGRRRRLPGSWVLVASLVELVAVGSAPAGWGAALRPLTIALFALAGVALLTRKRFRRPLLAVTLTLTGAANAATDGDPDTVLYVAAAGGGWDVYAARSTLDRLDTFARKPVPPVLLTAAEFDCTDDGTGLARFRATFRLHAAGDGATPFALPLADVRLDALTLDGRPALPTLDAPAGGPAGYAVTVNGRGPHTLTAEFGVPAAAVNGGREFRFAAPNFPATRLTFRSPAVVDVASRRGAQVVATTPQGTTATVEHGGGSAVVIQVREAVPTAAPVVSVREGHLWDVTESTAVLNSVYQWSVGSGAVAGIRLAYPGGLEPGDPVVVAEGSAGQSSVVPTSRITPDGAGQHLAIDFATPLSGRFTVQVRATPHAALATRPALAVPFAESVAAADAVVGLRIRGLSLDGVERQGLIDFPADELTRRFGTPTGWRLDRAPPDRVFQRLGSGAVTLRPTLSAKPDAGVLACETRWTLGPAAEVDAKVALTSFTATNLIEFRWPEAARLTEVRSPDLEAWVQDGRTVRVWLRTPTREATVTLAGCADGPPPRAGSRLSLQAVTPERLSAPAVLRVQPGSGSRAEWVAQAGVTLRPDSTAAETLLTLAPGVDTAYLQLTPRSPAVESPAPVPVPAPKVPPPPAVSPRPAAEPPPPAPASIWPPASALLFALVTPVALAVVAFARRLGLPQPECVTALGLTAVLLVGPAGLVVAALGLAWRVAKLAGRGWKLVMR